MSTDGTRYPDMSTHPSIRSNILRHAAALACALGVLAASSSALADGNVIAPSRLKPAERAQLVASVQAARKTHPKTFEAVRAVADRAAAMDARKRGRLAPMGPAFKSVGPQALLPMLELVALQAPARGNLSESAWIALRAGLLEAIGSHRDPLARPVLHAILEGPESEFYVVRAAAEATGQLGTDQDAALLVALSQTAGPRHRALLAGMGACRRESVARELARVLLTHPSDDIARVAVKSLGDVGSAWAWKTPSVATHASEEAATRALSASALVRAFVAYPGELRQACSNALMMVDDPSTPSLIAAAKAGAASDTVAALDTLAARFARNPTR